MRQTMAMAAMPPQITAPSMATRTSISPGTYQKPDDRTPATNAEPTRNRTSMAGA